MRDTLPAKPRLKESGIVNLDESRRAGTHWVAYAKNGNSAAYFDSFGNLRPPTELVRYLENCNLLYNRRSYQTFDTSICGQLCLRFLSGIDWRSEIKADGIVSDTF